MALVSELDHWHQTKKGLLTFGLFELVVAYLLGSLAIDNGSLIVYGIALIIFIGAIQNLVKLFRYSKLKVKKS